MGLEAVVKVGAGVAVASLLAYCVYFDYKRRSAPDYKDKVRQRTSIYGCLATALCVTVSFYACPHHCVSGIMAVYLC